MHVSHLICGWSNKNAVYVFLSAREFRDVALLGVEVGEEREIGKLLVDWGDGEFWNMMVKLKK